MQVKVRHVLGDSAEGHSEKRAFLEAASSLGPKTKALCHSGTVFFVADAETTLNEHNR